MNKIFTFCFSLILTQVYSQWTVQKPFEQKVFVENKGQYELKSKNVAAGEIFFGARQDGLHYYFTKNTIYIVHTAMVRRSEREIEAEMKKAGINEESVEKEEKEFAFKQVEEFHQMTFLDGGEQTEIVAQDKISTVYNFGSSKTGNYAAAAYKKIVYKNLYPGIDMSFYFPEDKQGFEYDFVVSPGADVSQIKIQFPMQEKVKLTDDGNIISKSSFGDFTEHAPVIMNQKTNCNYKLSKNILQIETGNYDKTKELIIDPWTTTPVFANGNNAYDVDWDNNGNCYVYGGTSPFQVIKFDNTGTQQWSYTNNFASVGGGFYYGDMVVNKSSGTVFISDGYNGSGATIEKINKNGSFALASQSNGSYQEIWRLIYYKCSNQIIAAGGGTTSPSYQMAVFDTNLVNLKITNLLNVQDGLHDFWGAVADANGNCYAATSRTQVGTLGYDNMLYKTSLPNISTIAWQSPTTYSIVEVASVTYASTPNGYNGICISDTNLYTYDGYVLKKWATSNGVNTKSHNVNGVSQSTMNYGGISSDECNNVFLGKNNYIEQYDGNLNSVNSFTVSGIVYDVNLSDNGVLYASGQGFVSAIPVVTTTCSAVNCAPGVGIQTFADAEFSIYPNPASNNVNIEFAQAQENTKVTLYNSMGEKIKSQNTNQKSVIISLQNLPEGVYMVEIAAKNRTSVKKFVKINP